jgi:transglutaminase-like putative cysteine protease
MNFLELFRRLVFTQVLLGIVAFGMAEPNPALLLVAGALGALSWYVTEGPTGRPLPRWTINLGALAAVAWLMVELLREQVAIFHVVIAMGHFILWLQVLMLYASKTNRDYAQMLVLSLLLMVTASVLPSGMSMIYGAMLAAYCVLALFVVLLFQLKLASDAVHEANVKSAPPRRWVSEPKAVVGRGFRWQFRGTALLLGLFSGGIAIVVFVLVPRLPDATWANETSMAAGREAGFAKEVRLGEGSLGGGSREPVLHVSFAVDGTNVGADGMTWLLRGAVMDVYDRGVWRCGRRTAEAVIAKTVPRDTGLQLAPTAEGTALVEATVTMRAGGNDALFVVYPTAWIGGAALEKVDFNPVLQLLSSPQRLGPGQTYVTRAPTAPTPGFFEGYPQPEAALDDRLPPQRWRGRELAGLGTPTPPASPSGATPFNPGPEGGQVGTLSQDGDNDEARRWTPRTLRLPEPVRQRLQPLALRVLKDAGVERRLAAESAVVLEHDAPLSEEQVRLREWEDVQAARALAEHLRKQYTYSLQSSALDRVPQDPLLEFLFTTRSGHCELFAAALAALCRSIDIPARVVTGYVAAEYNPIGGYYIVRQSNAHAWTEVYLGRQGWRTYDATPPALVELEHRGVSGWTTSLRQLYDYLEYTWLATVVGYDVRTRAALVDNLQQTVSRMTNDEGNWFGKTIAFLRDLPELWRLDMLSYSLLGVICFFIILGCLTLIRILVIRRRRLVALQLHTLPRGARRALARRLGFYLRMLDMLERHGYLRPLWQSPASFAKELSEVNPLRFDPVVALTELFYEIRFGHREMDADRRDRVRAHLRQLENALATPG